MTTRACEEGVPERDCTVLAIDDEVLIRETIASYLENRGFAVLTAENGRVGLEKFAAAKPDLVLVDLRMPEVDGLEVLARIREASPETPAIVVSGTGILKDAIDAIKRGAWDYVIKPIADMEVLGHAVDKALERARLIKENARYQQGLEAEIAERTAALSQSLEEKTLLLKELHHRVKNNLQLILSLMNLQAAEAATPAEEERMRRLGGRIRSMALVHEQLYDSGNFTTIDMKDYVASLASAVAAVYKEGTAGARLVLETSTLRLDINKSIPCGMLLNECITNAYKYAFPAGREGEIRVSLCRQGDTARITVEDDGRGLPPGFDPDSAKSLGFLLIKELTRQLGGTLTVSGGHGTRVTVEFPLESAAGA